MKEMRDIILGGAERLSLFFLGISQASPDGSADSSGNNVKMFEWAEVVT